MKKIVALLLALGMACCLASAGAETAAGTRLKLDGITLDLTGGEEYRLYEKAEQSAYLYVWPYYSSGDIYTNYTFFWYGGPFESTVESVKAEIPEIEASIQHTLGLAGGSMDGFVADDPYEATLNDVPCIVLDMMMEIPMGTQAMTVFEREIMLGSMGYIITMTALTQEELDDVTARMCEAITFD